VTGEYFLYGFKGARSAPSTRRQLTLEQRQTNLTLPEARRHSRPVRAAVNSGSVVRRAPTPLLGPSGHGGLGALQAPGDAARQLNARNEPRNRTPFKS
jgi:hypothetical protein